MNEVNIKGIGSKLDHTIIHMPGRTVITGVSEEGKISMGQLKRVIYVIRVAGENSVHTLKFTRK